MCVENMCVKKYVCGGGGGGHKNVTIGQGGGG